MARIRPTTAVLIALALGLLTGCVARIQDLLAEIDLELSNAVNEIQTEDPRNVDVPGLAQQGDTIIVDPNVTVVTDAQTDLTVQELPDINVVGFENQTGFDIFVDYFADADEQGIAVLDGETLLLEYPCLNSIELVSEDDFDVVTGEFVQSSDLVAGLFVNPDDFLCGDAVIFTFSPDGVVSNVDLIDLSH